MAGTPAEIRYYLLPGVEPRGLNGQFVFRDLQGFQLCKEGELLQKWGACQ